MTGAESEGAEKDRPGGYRWRERRPEGAGDPTIRSWWELPWWSGMTLERLEAVRGEQAPRLVGAREFRLEEALKAVRVFCLAQYRGAGERPEESVFSERKEMLAAVLALAEAGLR